MIATLGANIGTGDELNALGFLSVSSTEADAQISATEDCSFTGLGFNYIGGASGTNTLQFRDAGANGQNVASRAGTGVAEDTTHTDTLTAADLFNLAHTDNGTDPSGGHIKMNVEMASGHGNFHGATSYNGSVHDAQSATRFLAIAGGLGTDGTDTEALVSVRNRAYDSIAALQVRVKANARTNDSVFGFRANNASIASTAITFAAAETGLKTVTGLSDALTLGQDINAYLTLLTGVEDLTVSFVVATLKSSTGKSDSYAHAGVAGLARAASATEHFFPIGGRMLTTTTFTEAQSRIKPGFAATVGFPRIRNSANTYSTDGTLTLYVNGVAALTQAITAGAGAAVHENTADTVVIDADDELSWGIVGGGTGSITMQGLGVTFSPIAAGGSTSKHLLLLGCG